MTSLLKPSLNWLLFCVPLAAWLEHSSPDNHILIFATACLAILPLAGWMGTATEHLAARTGEAVGGLLNATFGNAAELIIAFIAMQKGLHSVVKASLTGSIIGNVLLVLGLSFFAGGLAHRNQRFSAQGARSQSTMLLLATVALVVPAAFHYLVAERPNGLRMAGSQLAAIESDLSLEIAIVLLVTYALSLLFSLHTHKQLFTAAAGADETGEAHAHWPMNRALLTLGGATALIAWMSEILVGSVEQAAKSLGMTSVFVGVIVVAIIGNAAEHSTAILVARKNRMDLSLGIALGSSIQIALFVAPLLVVASRFAGPGPMDLIFTPAEVVATGLAVAIAGQLASDGESNWFEGVQLLAVYVILGIMFYFLPDIAG